MKNFSRELVTTGTPAEVKVECLNTLQGPLADQGYKLTSQSDAALTYNATYRPWYIWVVGFLLFPIGLLGILLIKYEAPLTLTLEPITDGTRLRVSGKASKNLVEAFEAMEFQP